ncbi:MAG: hypothetical protein Q4C47_02155 [Planctomycetia bacterium]|nr:hypothetical protein [Planctomycetia bacterium]
MNEIQNSRRSFLASGVAVTSLLMSGCQAAMFTFEYLIHGNDRPADYDGLKGKTVAVVCRRPAEIQYNQGDIDVDLATRVGLLLKDHYRKKITIVRPGEVNEWADRNSWYEFYEVGKAVNADVVVGIDLESVSMNDGPTLHRGTFDLEVVVEDCESGEKLYSHQFSRLQYPRDRGIAITEKTARDFYRECVKVVAQRVAERFYPSDPYQDFAPDPAD